MAGDGGAASARDEAGTISDDAVGAGAARLFKSVGELGSVGPSGMRADMPADSLDLDSIFAGVPNSGLTVGGEIGMDNVCPGRIRLGVLI